MRLRAADFSAFLARCIREGLGSYDEIIVPAPVDGRPNETRWTKLSESAPLSLDGFRPVDPLKLLFYLPRETVSPGPDPARRRIVAGVKACDLRAMALLDSALLNDEFADPAYAAWRERTLVISADCTAAAATCHCTLAGGQPFAEEGFDVNASRRGDDYVLQAGTPAGHDFLVLIEAHGLALEEDHAAGAGIAENRESMRKRVELQNEEFGSHEDPGRVRSLSPAFWQCESDDCVGCGACTQVCPTCYCLILTDESRDSGFVKARSYDSCQWHGYALEASGASPRPRISERVRNRYLCKLRLLPDQFGRPGCTGCGRCTEACPAGIDMRAVVARALGGASAASGAPDASLRLEVP